MNLPNQLTVLRVLLIPVFVAVLAINPDWGQWDVLGAELPVAHFVAAMIFSVAAITDWLDGYLARKNKLVTNFGKFMDPLADKMLVAAALVYLVELDFVAAWVVVIILCREFAVTGLRLVASDEGIVLAAGNSGKAKTWVQLTSIIAFLLHDIGFALLNIPFAEITMWLALVLTIYSGLEYFSKNIKLITKSM
ncbi:MULTISPECIES: CDP-diacylglycerol--glycerol-3-phosphate 3-phosphatidyltransferase [Exiguobacterium]|uniref:CDP-diacylglycerol--glycerol-3-phosphate 3-phosphatidyltransferase n=1 Tax=Exiguobacterium antarcticum TaxID=132920 RepID=A0ABT6R1D4_9BACL|nr:MULTISPECIES: CDP-diacylglycerol--glycerol-3-phosphate 3-phosphatidyltransferase [Exiguobacterium]AFS70137.1 CDP-diacylglycerol--glycerol-3-phosphate 3-phosphatidyltransferase [Exiguobacterium antarcticum B7]MCT4779732.1 CDP-diacylglycerol--glycerol-3-phosphate 3-phosphatidyltransferase [Exiguobacterium soli]MDI3234750.1 CDP-diacylglycerol--glycerol-3-phosphate 3-phosphatidyltransferase [Exiguobacterium antarcticum]OIN68222.1 CDP-diacylglycerol--glycerol-3-phosphate 3-phosphatidyltransferase